MSLERLPNTPEIYRKNFMFFNRAAGIASILAFANRQGLVTDDWQGKRVVELGCGGGAGLWVLKHLGARPVGVDNGSFGGGGFYAQSALVADLPYFRESSLDFLSYQPDESFDAICTFDPIYDVWSAQVSHEVRRVLTANGVIVVSWNYYHPSLGGAQQEGWPFWKNEHSMIIHLGQERELQDPSFLKPLIDPVQLSQGDLAENASLRETDIFLTEGYLMVAKNYVGGPGFEPGLECV